MNQPRAPQHLTGKIANLLTLLMTLAIAPAAWAVPFCPISPDTLTISSQQVVNTYYPGTASAGVGATSISVGTPRGAAAIVAGDTLIVMQMQGAEIDTGDAETAGGPYGDGAGPNDRSGNLATNFVAGRYEFVTATGPVVGGVVPIEGELPGSGLEFLYTHRPTPTATAGVATFQVIRVPVVQDLTVTASGEIIPEAWDGSSGGVVALDIANTLTLDGTINVSGYGFRGGQFLFTVGGNANLTGKDRNGFKGEGIAGRPTMTYSTLRGAETNSVGYPTPGAQYLGEQGLGAPGNAGSAGGGSEDAGGGGGGNGGFGGNGGRGIPDLSSRGIGGASFADQVFTPTVNRLVMGGGGGGSNGNDGTPVIQLSSGQAGGGMIMARFKRFAGSGTFVANGDSPGSGASEGIGGGGAGGTVALLSDGADLSSATFEAIGGSGGFAQNPSDGGGGGGGGGLIFIANSTGVTSSALGGVAGGSSSGGDFNGFAGQVGVQFDTAYQLPPSAPFDCDFFPDSDGDGVLDFYDLDDDNDGITDSVEGSGDTDGDGVIDALDIDSDNDGIVDNTEAQSAAAFVAPSGVDTDGDGLDNSYDSDNSGTAIVVVNTDGIDQPDYLDDDADNDGVPDLIEGHDADGNGVADVSPSGSDDADGDGLNDSFDTVAGPAVGNASGSNSPLQNTDGADNRDWRDADDDNDGTATSGEDANSNNNFADDDADGDGTPDYLESSTTDADGDGVTDENDPNDADPCIPTQFGTGCTTDTDSDGTADSVEGEFTDSDSDGTPDYLEPSNVDTDGDGTNDQADPANLDPCIPSAFGTGCTTDTDGDGTPDSVEGEFTDSDSDGTPDYLEPSNVDTDSDGTNDQADPANTDPCIPSTFAPGCTTDTDGDGTPDSVEGEFTDSDSDGTPDYLEPSNVDTDSDGTNDQADPANTDPCIPSTFAPGCTADTDGDGTSDSVEGEFTDSDGDGTPDYLEPSNVDTDGDGVNDQADPANTDPCIPSAFGAGLHDRYRRRRHAGQRRGRAHRQRW